MAPRQAEEVFTDLSGQPDKEPSADQAAELERSLSTLTTQDGKPKIPDEDLEVADDEDEDGLDAGAADGDEEEEEEGDDGEVEETVHQASDFDPAQVDILVKDAEILDLKEKTAKSDKERAEADIKAATEAMETAQEAGDTKANIAATQKYTAATIALQTANNDAAAIATAKNALTNRAKALYAKAPKDAEGNPILTGKPAPKTTTTAAADKPSKLVPKFKAANPWFDNAKYAKQKERLIQLDRGLAAEGNLNKNTPEYFAELGKRFNREHPGLYKNLDGKPVATGERRRGNGQPIPGQGGAPGGRGSEGQGGSKVKLTSADLSQMRQFGMDPDNMGHRRQWLTEKRSLSGSA